MKKVTYVLVQLFLLVFPWQIRRFFLVNVLGYHIDTTAKIGLSIILSKNLIMEAHASIRSFSFCNAIDLLRIEEYGTIGTLVYITGYSTALKDHFCHVGNRKCELHLGSHSAITSRHFIDCTAGVVIGKFTTIAGIRSQILTHSIDLKLNRQHAISVEIGDYCFVGSGCIILPGSKLPSYSILSAFSLLNKAYSDQLWFYGGIPTKPIKQLELHDVRYFSRVKGIVD